MAVFARREAEASCGPDSRNSTSADDPAVLEIEFALATFELDLPSPRDTFLLHHKLCV
jgi:hypothetical protein